MKTIPLLPNLYKKIGWISLPFTLAFGIAVYYFEFRLSLLTNNSNKDFLLGFQNYTDELALSLFLFSLFFISFSKEKNEDEFLNHLRLSSFQWAVIFNTIILFIANWIFYNDSFLQVMMYNMFSTLIFYIIRFNLLLYRTKHEQ
ncbi:MAG: hypothetical protein ACLGGV_05560 [Bacteroidia bacterium]